MLARYFTLYSSKESIAARRISLLALLETALATGLYIWLTWYFETFAFFASAIVMAPLVLIRSEQSVALGVKWFVPFLNENAWKPAFVTSKSLFLASFAMSAVCALLIWFFQLVPSGLIALVSFVAFHNIMILLSISLFGFLYLHYTPDDKLDLNNLALVTGLTGYFASIPFRAVLTRAIASLAHFPSGIASIPRNWFRVIAVIDLLHLPELLPDIAKSDRSTSFEDFFRKLFVEQDNWGRAVGIVALAIIFLPAILYRWSLKASWWFYLPLVFLAGARVRPEDTEWRAKWLKTETKRYEWLGVILAALSLSVATISAIDPGRLQSLITAAGMGETVISAFSIFYILDWSSLYPWQYLTLPSTLLTIGLFFWIDHLAKDAKLDPSITDGWQLKTAAFLRRLRSLLVIAWLVLAVFYLFTFLHAQCDIPVWFNWIGAALDHYQTVACAPKS